MVNVCILYIYIMFQCFVSILETVFLPSPSPHPPRNAGWVVWDHELYLWFSGRYKY